MQECGQFVRIWSAAPAEARRSQAKAPALSDFTRASAPLPGPAANAAHAGPAQRQLGAGGPRLGAAAGDGAGASERAIWRSRRVAYLKLMLPAVALLIVTLILAWPQLMRDDNRVRFGGGR